MRKKKFDCVEMMHRGGDRIYQETKDLSREELKAYWEARNREMHERRRRLIDERKSA